MASDRFARVVAVIASVFFLGGGVWAMAAPRSFYRGTATFPPYNEHFLHDVGAFQLGLGAVLVFALLRWTGLQATLAGVAVGSVAHAASHVVDRDLGGRATDPVSLSLFAALVVAGAVASRVGGRRGTGAAR